MKRFYYQSRIMLMTFAFGLASVFVLNGALKQSDGVFVNLPQTQIGELIVVFPRYRNEMPYAGGAGGGQISIGCKTLNGKRICR